MLPRDAPTTLKLGKGLAWGPNLHVPAEGSQNRKGGLCVLNTMALANGVPVWFVPGPTKFGDRRPNSAPW